MLNQPYQQQDPSQWLSSEGKLSVDVIETKDQIIVRSPIAGVEPEAIHISLSDDTLTIRGERHHGSAYEGADVHVQECHWGAFSRTVILPSHVHANSADASLSHGVLTVTMQKAAGETTIPVELKD